MQYKPITTLTNSDEISAAFRVLYENAMDHAGPWLNRANCYREFLNESQYLKKFMDKWRYRPPRQGSEWMPRLDGPEVRAAIDNLVPQLVRSRPEIVVEPESDDPIDLRELDATGELVGDMSGLPSDVVAESATEILEGMRKHQGRIILDRNICEESLITGMAAVGFRFTKGPKGTVAQPRLIKPGDLLLDPECQNWHDFSDCLYTIETNYMSAPAIKNYYGVDENQYASTNENIVSTGSTFFGRVTQYFQRNSPQNSEYAINYYPVRTLYVREFIGTTDMDALDADPEPPMMKMTFIGDEFYYVSSKTTENRWWHKEFPYVLFNSAPNPYSQWGVSEIAKMYGTQIALNIARNTALAGAMRNANPPWKQEDGSVKHWNITPGGITRMLQGRMDAAEQAPIGDGGANAAAVWQALAQNQRETQGDSAGLLQGANPANINSGKHASIVLGAVLSKSGLRVLMLDGSWQRLARFEMSNLQQFIELDISHYMQSREFAREAEGLTDALRNLRYDVNIHSKDLLPSDPNDLFNLLFNLTINGFMDIDEFYRQYPIPISAELKDQIEVRSQAENFVPGLPIQMQAEAQVAAQSEINQIEESI